MSAAMSEVKAVGTEAPKAAEAPVDDEPLGLLGMRAAVGGVLMLQVDTYTIGYFPADHPVRVDNDFIEDEFGPYLPLEVVIDSGADGSALDYENWNAGEPNAWCALPPLSAATPVY